MRKSEFHDDINIELSINMDKFALLCSNSLSQWLQHCTKSRENFDLANFQLITNIIFMVINISSSFNINNVFSTLICDMIHYIESDGMINIDNNGNKDGSKNEDEDNSDSGGSDWDDWDENDNENLENDSSEHCDSNVTRLGWFYHIIEATIFLNNDEKVRVVKTIDSFSAENRKSLKSILEILNKDQP